MEKRDQRKHLRLVFLTLSLSLFGFGQKPVIYAQDFFAMADTFFQKHVQPPYVDYASIQQAPEDLNALLEIIANYPLKVINESTQKAFWINAYNLLVIGAIIEKYPIQSTQNIPGFFDRQLFLAGGEKMTLNQLEEEKLLRPFADPRIHFALVCAAQSCPPLPAEVFWPTRLDQQLEAVTRQAINDINFIRPGGKSVEISQIFRWYANDFGSIKSFLNQYLEVPLETSSPLRYYPYDWALNEKQNANAFPLPLRASYLLQAGQLEIKLFNSLYTQKNRDGFDRSNSRSTYFSSFGQVLFGLNRPWNLGFDLVYKSNVLNDFSAHSPFDALRFQNYSESLIFPCANANYNIAEVSDCHTFPEQRDSLRNAEGQSLRTTGAIGLSHFGPKFKINPFRKWENLSWQQTFYIPIQKKVDGQWVSFTQFFYDRPVGTRFQLFSEISLWTTIAPNFRVFPAVKVFYSYFPSRRWTIYAMTSIPVEYGLGTKLQLTRQLELELLYTHYLPISFLLGEARPSTFNLGFRYRR